VAAVVAILVVTLTLVLSRLDLANELVVVRSQLTAANQELAENQKELDELEDANRGQAEDVAACRELAELSQRLQQAVDLLQRALEGGDQGRLARGISLFVDTREQWVAATDRCAEAIPSDQEG
jgi:septal ring factor EnvC (AmiA/AmiB activator)